MNYRYKSPEELRADQTRRAAATRRSNRTATVIFLDIVILTIVFAAVYFGGFWRPGQETRTAAPTRDGDFVLWALVTDESGGRFEFSVQARNESGSRLTFPPPDYARAVAEIVMEDGARFSTDMPLPPRQLESNETAVFNAHIQIQLDRDNTIESSRVRVERRDQDALVLEVSPPE